MNFISPLVALEGLEPSQTEPESGVLPLHHKAILYVCQPVLFPFDDAKLVLIFELTKFFDHFF